MPKRKRDGDPKDTAGVHETSLGGTADSCNPSIPISIQRFLSQTSEQPPQLPQQPEEETLIGTMDPTEDSIVTTHLDKEAADCSLRQMEKSVEIVIDDSDDPNDCSVTEDLFGGFNLGLIDFIWPEAKFPKIMAPDGHEYHRSELRKMTEMLSDEKVEVIVGPERQRFLVPEALLCRSPYFRAVFKGSFRESSTKRSVLPEANANAFKLLIEALILGRFNSSKISNFHEFRSDGSPHLTVENRRNVSIWFEIIYLADMLQLSELQKDAEKVVSESLQKDRFYWECLHARGTQERRLPMLMQKTLINVFERTPPKANLRKIVMDHTFEAIRAQDIQPSKYGELITRFPEVAVEWMDKMQRRLKSIPRWR